MHTFKWRLVEIDVLFFPFLCRCTNDAAFVDETPVTVDAGHAESTDQIAIECGFSAILSKWFVALVPALANSI